ncbi:hypothetical protein BX600DRAFT_510924 [Xylariales sp. PMI_506]|nr:hypothetical protein BX600DRAFT_510924 [Xylariales sp. PMI_506]
MTDSQPEIVATADLTPESPKPINLSSPVVVPTLQDQADNFSVMSPSPPPIPGAGNTQTTTALPLVGESRRDSAIADVTPIDAPGGEGHIAEGLAASTEMDEDPDDYAKTFDSPEPPADETQLDDDIYAGESIPTSIQVSQSLDAETSKDAVNDTPATHPTPLAQDPSTASTAVVDVHPPAPEEVPTKVDTTRAEPTPSPIQDPLTTNVAASESDSAHQSDSASADGAIDIQALVDNITARAAAPEDNQTTHTTIESGPSTASHSSLPPRPPVSQQPTAADVRAEELRRPQPGNPSAALPNVPHSVSAPYPYPLPGVVTELPPGYAPPISNAYLSPVGSVPMSHQLNAGQVLPPDNHNFSSSQTYEEFLQEERKYVSEAKWDRFPEGSRLFIGNLSSERVSKKEVFDIFSQYGRLAQISLKQAYGFTQYHAVTEGQAAMTNLQGIEIKGRKIHLEISRAQKKEGDGDKRNRGSKTASGQNDRDRDRGDNRRRDGYRPRSPSPSRGNHYRQESSGRDRRHWDSSDRTRRRSRSPEAYGSGGYRRRSPSPYSRAAPASEADLDIPRRYAGDVPDVQLLLLQEVNRDFVNWVQGSFIERGLKVDVMFLNPRFPRELVIQRQVVEGVHGVSELDFRAQSVAKIPLQVFDRSAGRHNARFDQYQDLDPKIAAELIARAKGQAQHQLAPSYPPAPQYPPTAYAPHMQHQQPYGGQPAANLNLGALQNLDNATLQRVLAAIQTQGALQGQQPVAMPGTDVNAVLSALGGGVPGMPPMQSQPQGYPSGPAAPGAPPQGNASDQAHVQNIMAQLSRYRQ